MRNFPTFLRDHYCVMSDNGVLPLISRAKELFRNLFGAEATIVTSAPGRLNFGGEHCDYMGGYVLPFPTTLVGVVAGRRTEGKRCRVYSESFKQMIQFDCDETLERGPKGEWGNYFKGVCHYYLPDMPDHCLGFDLVFISNVTIGGGISSSAAVEISTCLFIERCLGITVDPKVRAMRAHDAEHTYVQMPCGVMDQLISSCGQYGKISLIDCISHDITHYYIDSKATADNDRVEWPVTILKLFVRVRHKLVNSEYTTRVKECLEGERLLKEKFNGDHEVVKALCRGPTLEMLETMKGEMPENVYKRCYHMIRETQRTLRYVDLIQQNDWDKIGELFFESYDDSRDFFDNGHPDITACIDILKEIGRKGGVYGARMLGGGWGGSILCLIEKGKEGELVPLIQKRCDEKLQRKDSCDVMVVYEAGAGAKVWECYVCFIQ